MSVYESDRKLSELQFYQTAVDIRLEVTKLVHRKVPKSSRLYFALPTAETARSMLYNIRRGIAFYPNSESNVNERKKYYTLAIADCYMLQEDFKAMIAIVDDLKASTVEKIICMIDQEITLLRGTRKNVKQV